MGADKAFIEIDGVAMAARVARALTAAGATTVRGVGGDVGRLAEVGVEAVADIDPGQGPLAGVVRALAAVGSHRVVAVLSCDLLTPDPTAIAALVGARAATDADVTVPIAGGRPQWTHAVWHRRVSGMVASSFAAGERSLVGVTTGLDVARVELGDPTVTADADRPEDLPAGGVS